MATFHLSGATTVADLCEQFNTAFGSQLKIYNANKVADPSAMLSEVGLTADAEFTCYANLTVGSFILRMKEEYGLKVKVYTCDEWVACLDGLTLESSGKVKKKAVKADMESMIAYQRTETSQPSSSNNTVAEKKCNDGALNGLFSVSPNKKIRFSMGNLQFNAKKYEFRFADHQWDIIGEGNEKISPNYDGWIDMFGYGTSGYMGCQPYETSENGEAYPNQHIADTKNDWGVYNPIVNGGNKAGLWRTLTGDEWTFLMNKRLNYAKLRTEACVNGVNGVIFLPDNFYENRVPLSLVCTRLTEEDKDKGYDYKSNILNLDQWSILEKAGAVFLPSAGERRGGKVNLFSVYWSYWSSSKGWTQYDDNRALNATIFSNCYHKAQEAIAVRLVQDIK